MIKNVEPNAEIGFWTYYLSPTFDEYIKDTIARFQKTYPGVKVDWDDHQATFQDDLNNAFAAGNAPDVINLSVGEGWVSDYASKGLLLPLDDKVPADVQDIYFPGLWKDSSSTARTSSSRGTRASRRADQQAGLRDEAGLDRRGLPEDDRRPPGHLPDPQRRPRPSAPSA